MLVQPPQMKRQTATVECPKSMVGRVIGKNGETIKSLQAFTGALIQIDQTVDPTRVTISGTPQSLSIAVSMVTDVVKGTFKGFALLRQVANPQNSRAAFPMAANTPRPMYAPGYGLIPPSQLYGTGEPDAVSAAYPRPQAQMPQTFTYGAQLAPSQMLLGGMRPMVQQPGQLISTQGLQAVYTQQGAPYGSIAYAYPQDAFGTPMAGGATLQPDGTLVYQDGSVVLQQMTAGQVAMGPPGMGAGGKLMQVAGAKPGGGGAGGGGVSWSAAGKADGNGASGEMLAASNGGGLVQVMDAEGQVYYYNPNET